MVFASNYRFNFSMFFLVLLIIKYFTFLLSNFWQNTYTLGQQKLLGQIVTSDLGKV